MILNQGYSIPFFKRRINDFRNETEGNIHSFKS